MKKIYLLLFLLSFSFLANAQCPVQVQVTPPSCFGGCNGSATAFGSGNGPFTYQWTTTPMQTTQTATGLCAGTYSVIVVNGSNCTGVATVTVNQPPQLMVQTTSQASTSCINCNGSLISTTFGGTPNYTFSWSPGSYTSASVTGVCPGTYTFFATDANGCTAMATQVVNGPQGPGFGVSATQANNVNCNNGTATATPSNPNGTYTYLWTPTNQTTQTATGLTQGVYTVCVTDQSNGCSSCQLATIICQTTGTNEHTLDNSVSLFPNPTKGKLTISAVDLKITNYEIFDILGSVVSNSTIQLLTDNVDMDISALTKGVFFIKINTSKGYIVKKIVKD